jgi:hypothetical protein
MRCISFLLLTVLAAAPAAAQETVANPRYVFTPVDEGALRLNTETGEGVALRRDARIALLHARAGRGARCCNRHARFGGSDRPIGGADRRIGKADQGGKRPASDEEALDRVMTLTDRMMRQFFGLVREMRREFEGETL